jgi:hypothetical protein
MGAAVTLLPIAACAAGAHVAKAPAQPLPDAGLSDASDDAEAVRDAGDAEIDAVAPDAAPPNFASGPCPPEMALVGATCIDRWEAALVATDGSTLHWYDNTDKIAVRATSQPDVFPSGYVSRDKAEEACGASGKRLCKLREWRTACTGSAARAYPYGAAKKAAACNDSGRSPLGVVFPKEWAALQASIAAHPAKTPHRTPQGKPTASLTKGPKSTGRVGKNSKKGGKGTPAASSGKSAKSGAKTGTSASSGKLKNNVPAAAKSARRALRLDTPEKLASWSIMNDPRLLQVDGTVAPAGAFAQCTTPEGVHDLVGNLHEWVADDWNGSGIFAGGYFLDTTINGEGCMYSTRAHAPAYHDYSIGFRCCKDAVGVPQEASEDAGAPEMPEESDSD